MPEKVLTGLDVLRRAGAGPLAGKRLGLVVNAASVASDLGHAADILRTIPGVEIVALFGPEHGIRGEAQDMEPVGGGRDPGTGLPVHSLYGADAGSLAPTGEMMARLDALVVDLPDIGARYYTYAATLFHVLECAAREGLPVHVLDRPNPIDGVTQEGPGLKPGFESFVGRLDVPVRHGLTLAELARLFVQDRELDVELSVVRCEGWSRTSYLDETGLPWVLPSPNMPTMETAVVYPGGCLLEGTNLSEGRGTTRPFEHVGAPWLDAPALAAALNDLLLPGVHFRAHWFRPLAQKWQGQTCAGVQVHVTGRRSFRPFATYVALIAEARRQDPGRFAWREDAYEFETRHPAIDLLAGSAALRRDIEEERALPDMEPGWSVEVEAFAARREGVLLYP